MKKLLNRKEALGMIDAIFTSLHFNLISIKDLGIENSKERDYFLTEAWKIDQGRLKKDYEQTVNSLDAIGFKEYYKLIGKFATKYKIGCWKEYNEYEPILIEELNEELRKYDKTEDKLELINSFTVDELQSESFIFDSKVQVLYDILDDFNVGNKKEEGINTVLESFNSSDKASFIAKLQTDKNLLNALIDKVNGNEKNQLLTYLYKFLSSADGFGVEEYKLPPKAGFDAKYKKGKVIISTYYYIDRKISRYKYRYIEKNRELNPFTNVTFCYGNDQNEITVPAIVLVKSRGDVVLYDDFYKSNIDWKSLTEEKKRELYTEFVLHYLPKELGDAAVGNPITFLIMIIVGAVIAKASAVIAACASLIGTGFSAVNIIEGCKMITKVAEGYDSISDVNAAKVSAKDCARGIALLGVEIIPVLFGLVKRGIAKYNGKEISVGEGSKQSVKSIKDVVEQSDHGYQNAHNASQYAKYKALLKATESANPLVESLKTSGKLPSNYITQADALALGWKPGKALNNYVKGGQLGGSIFRNIPPVLPELRGRIWYEADIGLVNTISRAKQPGTRLLYSNDGLLYITIDHYKTVHKIGTWK